MSGNTQVESKTLFSYKKHLLELLFPMDCIKQYMRLMSLTQNCRRQLTWTLSIGNTGITSIHHIVLGRQRGKILGLLNKLTELTYFEKVSCHFQILSMKLIQ